MSSSGENKGEFLSPECKEGPVQDRSCTDLLCLIVFTVTFVGLFGVAIYGFQYGQPTLLYTPMDPDGTFIFIYVYFFFYIHLLVLFSIFFFFIIECVFHIVFNIIHFASLSASSCCVVISNVIFCTFVNFFIFHLFLCSFVLFLFDILY